MKSITNAPPDIVQVAPHIGVRGLKFMDETGHSGDYLVAPHIGVRGLKCSTNNRRRKRLVSHPT